MPYLISSKVVWGDKLSVYFEENIFEINQIKSHRSNINFYRFEKKSIFQKKRIGIIKRDYISESFKFTISNFLDGEPFIFYDSNEIRNKKSARCKWEKYNHEEYNLKISLGEIFVLLNSNNSKIQIFLEDSFDFDSYDLCYLACLMRYIWFKRYPSDISGV
jgi:hypothetical protein